ncbi:hypothetical protein [Kocuria sp. WRN011]|nr:hypothetical protein [Kocuria sp. WRN011]
MTVFDPRSLEVVPVSPEAVGFAFLILGVALLLGKFVRVKV